MSNRKQEVLELEAEAAGLIARALKLEQDDDGDTLDIERLMTEALALQAKAAEIRRSEGLPPRSPIEEYREVLKAHGIPFSGKRSRR